MKKNKKINSIAYTIIKNFLLKNLFMFSALFILYMILYLFLSLYPSAYAFVRDFYKDMIVPVMSVVFDTEFLDFIFTYHYCLYFIGCFWIFVFNCFTSSLSALINFDKTYRSIDAFADTDRDISAFSKDFSDIEIKLKDIKLDVLESRSLAAEAENKKNDLVMYLAHDLKTPLTSVIGYLTLLDETPEIDTEHRAKFTGIALDKAYRLEQLITEFFEITRFNIDSITLQKNRIDLGMMISQMSEEFYPMVSEKNIRINIDIPDRILMLADSDKIARVFDNLLKNAVNYSYENTTIIIGARIRQNRVIIKFRNKCDEIPPQKLERLFEKFYRTDTSRSSSSGGSGLGLAIAKQITELHGGTIHAKSTVDYTDFTVILPFINAAEITEDQLEF